MPDSWSPAPRGGFYPSLGPANGQTTTALVSSLAQKLNEKRGRNLTGAPSRSQEHQARPQEHKPWEYTHLPLRCARALYLVLNVLGRVMAGDGSAAAFGYHEPTIATLLYQTGFLLVLNIVNFCLDKPLYCGLIGQLFIGILWGTPGAKWLDRDTETVIQQLGYIGLIMLVYEDLVSASSLQAFAAGAALSATSLGTTFTILSKTKLIATRLGTVTTSAAMLDDVVGLVMVQIISNLGGSTSSFSAMTVIRPVFVSIGAFTLSDNMPKFMGTMQFAFLAQTCVLVGIVAGATKVPTGEIVYEKFYKEPISRILIPLFFGDWASIGFSIPITAMFQGSVVWRGIIYALLMILGKMVTGLLLVRFSLKPMFNLISAVNKPLSFLRFFCPDPKSDKKKKQKSLWKRLQPTSQSVHSTDTGKQDETKETSPRGTQPQFESGIVPQRSSSNPNATFSLPPKPKSLYPASILGLAMIARGEVGYLIASLAESQGMFSSGSNEETSEIYLVVIWAISICTLIGPISVGTLVKRVKKLQQSRETLAADPLGLGESDIGQLIFDNADTTRSID
ncbi:hypothetical protein PENANT_c058G04644 [Penicillium antarcticum]|uniref:Cation/H+ exchanger transmembrane domain-containing protein n=1 Tax=Penicillium antarcticum TaxID=416450 RepID=A0A1V6PQD1_9EURO|nr:hypothetical protein PENANT_c058G04644 [Penicillium antarcticum]